MKASQHVLFVLVISMVDAYVVPSVNSFIRQPSLARFVSATTTTSAMTLDNEAEGGSTRDNLEKIYQKEPAQRLDISSVEESLGMPWKDSIDKNVKDEELLYMPFWEWQMSFMKEKLSNLRVEACTDGKTDFSYNENTKKKARIVNMCASSDEYRKIRMTYYDAGDNTQVFNSVWYPDPAYNLPVLGIDLLAFNRKKYLAIVDFQPIHAKEEDHSSTYEHLLRPIKNKYESLKGRMSSKFYDETKFFSQEMLFARFDDESVISNDLFPAFKAYVETHLDLVKSTEADASKSKFVLNRQKAYDTYSAERDPATGLFAAMFGGEWAGDFVHNFLFSMSERSEGASAPTAAGMAFMGGPPRRSDPPRQQQQQQKQQQQQQQPQAAKVVIPTSKQVQSKEQVENIRR
jgi:15,16-dihydrobiliverdin:ferredoxin oxidoreductase